MKPGTEKLLKSRRREFWVPEVPDLAQVRGSCQYIVLNKKNPTQFSTPQPMQEGQEAVAAPNKLTARADVGQDWLVVESVRISAMNLHIPLFEPPRYDSHLHITAGPWPVLTPQAGKTVLIRILDTIPMTFESNAFAEVDFLTVHTGRRCHWVMPKPWLARDGTATSAELAAVCSSDGLTNREIQNPWRTDILDFVSSQPRKRVRFINDDGDGEDDVSDSPRPPKKHRSNLILSSDDESGSDSEPKAANKATAKSTPIIDHEDTEFDVDCRCGQQGVITGTPSELLAKCTEWERCHGSREEEEFRCYSCHSPSEILGVHRPAPTKRKRKKPDAPSRTKLTNRLLAGKGALARYGTYWYPVRLIHKHAGVWEVAEGDLVDELWANAGARRAIQLGRWTHACETGVEEDEVFEFLRAPYTEEIETALRPHIDILQQLHDDPDGQYPLIPASVFSSQQRFAKSSKGSEMMRHGDIPHTGDLRSTDCAGVANWVHHCVRGAKNSTSSWMGRVPLAHAYTLLIAHRHHTEILAEIDAKPKYASMDRQVAILELAWTRQKRPMHRYPDVDHECLNIFEERLFEYSFATGRAGNHQWGLDIGPHQEGWNPYANIPAHWNHDDREDESESELAVFAAWANVCGSTCTEYCRRERGFTSQAHIKSPAENPKGSCGLIESESSGLTLND
ncbi:hypothetical protein DFH06DRAFT_1309175 [Mycena polygramma]|nr:hypothetical protein DFH06DRAFT_1309175 [Mycena polygramma]